VKAARFLLRLPPALHRTLRARASAHDLSLNEYCVRKLAGPTSSRRCGASAARLPKAGGPGAALAALRPDQKQVFGALDPWQGRHLLPTMLLLMGEANMYQKFFSAKDSTTAKRGHSSG
jgi:HicB family